MQAHNSRQDKKSTQSEVRKTGDVHAKLMVKDVHRHFSKVKFGLH